MIFTDQSVENKTPDDFLIIISILITDTYHRCHQLQRNEINNLEVMDGTLAPLNIEMKKKGMHTLI